MGYIEDQVVVAPVVMLIVSLLDGERDLSAVCDAFHRQTGHRISEVDADRVITQLDELGLLESPRFIALRDETDAAFKAAETRPAYLAGRAYIERSGRNIAVVAGADLAHVGRRFGDSFDIDDAVLAAVKARDDEDLAHAARADAMGWYQSVQKDGNERRVCGVNCIYAALSVVSRQVNRADTLYYGYAPDPAGGIVSFADMALY